MFRFLIYLRFGHIVLDLCLLYGAFVLAYFVRVGWVFSTDFSFWPFAIISLVSVLAWSGFLIFTKYYRLPPRTRPWYDLALILVGGVIAAAVLIIVYYFQRELFFSRLLNIYVITFGAAFLILSRFCFGWLLRHHKRHNQKAYRTLIIGANSVSESLIKSIKTNPYALYEVIGVIDPYGLKKTITGSVILGKLDKLTEVCEKENVTAIIQCDAYEHTLNIISLCEEKNIKYQFDPALRGIYEKNLRIREVAGQTMISFVKRDFDSSKKRTVYALFDRVLKQVFDVD